VPKKNEFGSEIIAVLLRIVFSLDNDNSWSPGNLGEQ
jgi:hypothetical protein